MEIITIRSQIKEVAERWKEQYQRADGTWAGKEHKRAKGETFNLLKALNKETATAKEVENIIGNDLWACAQCCYECSKYFNTVIQVGGGSNSISAATQICPSCLKKALKMIEED